MFSFPTDHGLVEGEQKRGEYLRNRLSRVGYLRTIRFRKDSDPRCLDSSFRWSYLHRTSVSVPQGSSIAGKIKIGRPSEKGKPEKKATRKGILF